MDPLTLNIKMPTTSHKIIQVLIIFAYAFNRNKHAKLYLPSMFQASDIELLSKKIETYYTSH